MNSFALTFKIKLYTNNLCSCILEMDSFLKIWYLAYDIFYFQYFAMISTSTISKMMCCYYYYLICSLLRYYLLRPRICIPSNINYTYLIFTHIIQLLEHLWRLLFVTIQIFLPLLYNDWLSLLYLEVFVSTIFELKMRTSVIIPGTSSAVSSIL